MIEVKNVCKKYGSFEAVKDVSFSVGRAELLGFLGPNGAGKTTIMKILTAYHLPSGGQVTIDGLSIEDEPEEIKKRVGYLPEGNPLYGDLSPDEYLYFIASARFIPKNERQKAVDAAVALCGLEGARGRRIENLSKGYKQRVGLAQAIIHDPDILILDEPTSGLDPNQIIEIRALVRELGKRKTVILSTHILQEVEAVCSRVLILNKGVLAAQGTSEEIARTMRNTAGEDSWELCLRGTGPDLIERLGSLVPLDLGSEIAEASAETRGDGSVKLRFAIKNTSGSVDFNSSANKVSDDGELIFDWAVSQGYKITEMKKRKLSLEDIFVNLTSGEQKET